MESAGHRIRRYVRTRTDGLGRPPIRSPRASHSKRAANLTIFRCTRLEQQGDIDVANEIAAMNRMLERRFPDCTVQIVEAGDYGQSSQWVTVELEVTPQSPACAQWYVAELGRKGVALHELQISLRETDLMSS